MISGRDFIFISSIEWEPLWQAHQEIAARLAEGGNRVLYVENTGVRRPGISDTSRVVSRLRGWAAGVGAGGVRQVRPGLFVCSPLALPPFEPAPARALNRWALAPLIARRARALGMRDPVLWTYLPTDTAVALIERLRTPSSLVVYACLADFAQLASGRPRRERLERCEAHLLRMSDLVLAHPGLVERCRRFSDRVHGFRSAVDLDVFSPMAHTQRLSGLPRPLIGYVGGLHRHLDLDLLTALARARPKWSWLFVGPRQESVGALEKLPNVHLLGPRQHSELPELIAAFDVCLVPYRESPYMHSGVPTKIMEYLAMGKPVVSTPLPLARELEERGVVLTAPREVAGFLAGVERALSLPPDGRLQRSVAAERGWDRELERIRGLLEAAAARRRDSRAQPAPEGADGGSDRRPAPAADPSAAPRGHS